MSEYDNLETLLGGGSITKAAILQADRGWGHGVRVASSGFNISPAEQKAIANVFDAYKYQNISTDSVDVAGGKFKLKEFRSDEWYRGEKTTGSGGLICYNTVASIIVVEYSGTFTQAHNVAEGVLYDLRETGN